MTVFE